MKRFLTLTLIILFSGIIGLQAQDKIYKKNKEVIICKIQKVGVKLIEYTQPDFNEGVIFTIAKDRVEKIVFESGSTMDLVEDNRNPEDYSNQRKSIIKIDFFSPLSGNLTLGYERSLGVQKSFEVSIGIIGIGVPKYENARGAFFRIGYKFIRSPEVYFNAMHYSHILKGFYIRPDFIFSYYSYDVTRNITSPIPGGDIYQKVRTENLSGAFILNIGKQWIMDDKFSMSWFGGIGYAFSTEAGYYYSHVTSGNEFPIALSAGLCFGILP